MGAGIVVPNFLVKKLYKEENKRLELKYINLQEFYKKKEEFDNVQIEKFVKENKDQLKIEYLDFDYIIINPKILTGVDEFNQAFFDKIDQIEIDISNEINVKTIAKNFNIKPQSVTNFRLSSDANEIEKKIFESKNIRIDIIENKNDYILYQINKSEEKDPDLNDEDLKNELIGLIYEKNKFDYNQKLLKKIDDNIFTENDFLTMGKDRIKKMILNSFNDNEKFDANSVKLLYSLPSDSYTLVADKKNNIYLIKIEKEDYKDANMDNKIFNEYLNKQKSESRSSILKTYDLLLNEKYNVELNEKTIDRVKNFFQ